VPCEQSATQSHLTMDQVYHRDRISKYLRNKLNFKRVEAPQTKSPAITQTAQKIFMPDLVKDMALQHA